MNGGGWGNKYWEEQPLKVSSSSMIAEAFKCQAADASWLPPEIPTITEGGFQGIHFSPCDIKKQLRVLDRSKVKQQTMSWLQ